MEGSTSCLEAFMPTAGMQVSQLSDSWHTEIINIKFDKVNPFIIFFQVLNANSQPFDMINSGILDSLVWQNSFSKISNILN